MEFVQIFNSFITLIFVMCYSYQFLYIFIPYFIKEHPHKKTVLNKYRVLICARNEEKVIADLIESINCQNYPKHLITIFVVADNCTDNTRSVAKKAGAMVYTRNNHALVGKGYAMEYLLKQIENDYGSDTFDGYFVFDADNILDENYISEMNKTFCDGYEIITGYRNSKNYDDNWLSAGYSLWFMRENRFLNHPRHLAGLSCAVSGTGFMFSNKVLKVANGWPFHLLTEDIEFTAWNITEGRKIAYCPTAEFYDEQPTIFKQSWTQRMRWAKGNYQVFGKYKTRLAKCAIKNNSFSCFDMVMNLAPAVILSILSIVVNISAAVITVLSGGNILLLGSLVFSMLTRTYNMFLSLALLTTVTQWNHIHTQWYKKIFYMFTFPLFMRTYVPIAIAALFTKVNWQPILHTKSKKLSSIKQCKLS